MDDTRKRQLAGKADGHWLKWRTLYVLLFCLLVCSCGYKYRRAETYQRAHNERLKQKSDTLVVLHSSCTECSDLYITGGVLTIPEDLKGKLKNNNARDIKVCGNFPLDFLEATGSELNSAARYKVWGKVILLDTANSIGALPVFYAEGWLQLR